MDEIVDFQQSYWDMVGAIVNGDKDRVVAWIERQLWLLDDLACDLENQARMYGEQIDPGMLSHMQRETRCYNKWYEWMKGGPFEIKYL